MSFAATCGWTLLRCLAISSVAVPICHLLFQLLPSLSGHRRRWAWCLLLLPFLTPELIVGYAYSNFSLSLIQHAHWNELLYAVLVLVKGVPVGVVMLSFAPPPALTAEAIHCRIMAIPTGVSAIARWRIRIGLALRGPFRSYLPAWAVVFLLAFQEFEMASLMNLSSWTVWLFDAQAGGMMIMESVKRIALPVAIELCVILPVLFMLVRNGKLSSSTGSGTHGCGFLQSSAGWSYLTAAAVLACAIPFGILFQGSIQGLPALVSAPGQFVGPVREIGTACSFAAFSGIGTALVTSQLVRWYQAEKRRRPFKMVFLACLVVPGLLGSLIVGMLLLLAFQTDGFHVLYNTRVPLYLALFLLLVPRAFFLQMLLSAVGPNEGVFLAQFLQRAPQTPLRQAGDELTWKLRHRGVFLATALLCYWAYFDLSATTLLAPVGLTPVPVRLYNLMHYSRQLVLSVLTMVAIAVPVAGVFLAMPVYRRLLRWVTP